MTLYLDVSAAVHHRAGLGRYAESLARGLAPRLGERLALFYNAEAGVAPLVGLEKIPASTVALGYKPWRMAVWLGQLAHMGFDRLLPGAALYHATEHLLLPLRNVPTVITVHDLIFRRLAQYHKPLNRWYLSLTLPLFCRRARHIIAVSAFTKQDLVTAYGLPEEKITVIYEAADPRFRPASPGVVASARARYRLPARYVLYVGTIEPRKNLIRLLSAFEQLYAAGLSDALVIVGKRGWLYADFFTALAQSPACQAVLFPGYVPDEDLPALYTGSQALAFPSLFEGFGLPVIEAMACNAPVVCADRGSLPEIAGEAALLINPEDVDALAGALRRVIEDQALAADLRLRGLAQSGRFSWDRTVSETLAVYQRLGFQL